MSSAPSPRAMPITRGPAFHFFGYYDKFQVDATGTKMLTMEVDFMDRMPTGNDTARIGVVDLADGNRLSLVGQTRAWCWQQSCMLQWLASDPGRGIIFNTRVDDGHYGCCVLDVETGEKRQYDTPVYTISSDGRFALCPNFSRLAVLRPGYGYEGVPDPWGEVQASPDDGIWFLDLESGERRLIISLAQIRDTALSAEDRDAYHWFNHLLISPDDRRFIFLHRWYRDQPPWKTRMFTANVDGSDIHLLNADDMTSHFIWRDSATVLAWARRFGQGDHYYYFTDRTDEVRVLAPDKLPTDGHMSYSPRGTWFVTDTYPRGERRERHLLLVNENTEEIVELGRFRTDPRYAGPIRTDLHPRWSRDGKTITFDSIHEGSRQVYLLDVGAVVG